MSSFTVPPQHKLGQIALPPGSPWPAKTLKTAYESVKANKAGACTHYGYAAAHILTNGREAGPRVEIVAWDLHVYVLVGRKGEPKGKKIPNDWQRQKDLIVVDGWAGAMGYEVIFKGCDQFVMNGMIDDLDFISGWPAK